MYLFSIEPDSTRSLRLTHLARRVLHRLGDSQQKIWTLEEIESYIRRGGLEMVTEIEQLVWDQTYAENLPAGFSHTADFEVPYLWFRYGRANYTAAFEEPYLGDVDMELDDDIEWANHTGPSDRDYLAAIEASTAMRATSELPENLIQIDRGTWDNRTIDAGTSKRAREHDYQYETTVGEVYAYVWQNDGPRTLRKIRVPGTVADTFVVEGSWGIVRDIADVVSDDTVTGTWGIPRRIPDWHPMGDTGGWGVPRRFFRDGKNTRIEHWRQFAHTWTESELPHRYFLYLQDYAHNKALVRNGPGQDYKLAQLYKDRWARNLARLKSRVDRENKNRLSRMGGGRVPSEGPPRPRLPWQYGSVVR